MHAAKLDRSARLKAVLGVLVDGKEHSTLDIIRKARVCAVNSCVAELRANGFRIDCTQRTDRLGRRRWFYRLLSERRAA